MMATMARWSDVLTGALLAGLGAYIITQSLGWEVVGSDGPGPGFFPLGYGIAISFLSVCLVMSSWMKQATHRQGTPKSLAGNQLGLGLALLTWAAFTSAVAVIPILGFVVSLMLLTFFLVLAIFRQPIHKAALTALGCGAGFYLLFPFALGIELPTGRLGF